MRGLAGVLLCHPALRKKSFLEELLKGPGLKPPIISALNRGLKAPSPSGKTFLQIYRNTESEGEGVPPALVVVPGFYGDFKDGEEDAEGGNEAFGALPVLLVAVHAALQLRDAAAVAVAHQAGDLCFEDGEVAEDLGFEFIHHAHWLDSIRDQRSGGRKKLGG
jgi:hypothetical protein